MQRYDLLEIEKIFFQKKFRFFSPVGGIAAGFQQAI